MLTAAAVAGEAASDAMKLEPGQVCGWVSTTREMLARFVETHLPLRYDKGKDSSAPWAAPLQIPCSAPAARTGCLPAQPAANY